jgi:hypothetical protein
VGAKMKNIGRDQQYKYKWGRMKRKQNCKVLSRVSVTVDGIWIGD